MLCYFKSIKQVICISLDMLSWTSTRNICLHTPMATLCFVGHKINQSPVLSSKLLTSRERTEDRWHFLCNKHPQELHTPAPEVSTDPSSLHQAGWAMLLQGNPTYNNNSFPLCKSSACCHVAAEEQLSTLRWSLSKQKKQTKQQLVEMAAAEPWNLQACMVKAFGFWSICQ